MARSRHGVELKLPDGRTQTFAHSCRDLAIARITSLMVKHDVVRVDEIHVDLDYQSSGMHFVVWID